MSLRRRRRTWRATLLVVCVVVVAASLIALRRFRLPAPTGSYAVGTSILNMMDETRGADGSANPTDQVRRALVVQVWYPAVRSHGRVAGYQRWQETSPATSYEALLPTNSRWDAPFATAGAPFPVLLFGHRWEGQRTQNTDLAEDLASHGYVVVAVDHPYNSSRVLFGDGHMIRGNQPLEGPKGEAAPAADRIAYWNQQLDVWAADDIFVLNQLATKNSNGTDTWHGKLNMDRVGAFGHSFGGAVALRLCGLDPRVVAAVNLDGWSFGALHDRTAEQQVLMMYEQVSLDREKQLQTLPMPGTMEDQLDRTDMAAVNASLHKFGGEELYIAGTQHLDFSDQPLLPPLRRGSYTGPIAPLRIQAIVRQGVLGFFDQALRSRPSPLLENPQKTFPEVISRKFPPIEAAAQ